ncbi:hypothetical protein LCGC14_0451260 [marine sediment metagenome]|uniref:Single-stranded DNA-binding protein n=1 Tax=marine sediment metagenome TaxID=412755 RepID=A0A0F9SHT4_9ZZZZ
MNVIFVSGLVQRRETVQVQGGSLLTKLTIRTEENYISKAGEPKTSHTSFDIVCWGNLAQQTEHYLDGSYLQVRGRMANRAFEHQGNKRWKWELIAANVELIVEPMIAPAAAPAEPPAAEEKAPTLFGGDDGQGPA